MGGRDTDVCIAMGWCCCGGGWLCGSHSERMDLVDFMGDGRNRCAAT